MKSEISRQIFEKYLNMKCRENSFYGRQTVSRGRVEGQRGGQTDIVKLTVATRNFAKGPK